MEILNEIREAQRSQGIATVLAIGSATPSNFIYQSQYADYFFRVTKSEHLTELKQEFQKICKPQTQQINTHIHIRFLTSHTCMHAHIHTST
jgi:chalcone synthase